MTVIQIKEFLDENYSRITMEEYVQEKSELQNSGGLMSSVENIAHGFLLEGVRVENNFQLIKLIYVEDDVNLVGFYKFTDSEKQYFPDWAVMFIDDEMGWIGG